MFKTETIGGVVAGAFMLVLVYLLVTNATGTASVIGTIGSNAVNGLKTLQGR